MRQHAWKLFGEAISSGLLPGGIEQHAEAHLEMMQQRWELEEAEGTQDRLADSGAHLS
jgi:hypothetical protein